jgi:hypothetical protein
MRMILSVNNAQAERQIGSRHRTLESDKLISYYLERFPDQLADRTW